MNIDMTLDIDLKIYQSNITSELQLFNDIPREGIATWFKLRAEGLDHRNYEKYSNPQLSKSKFYITLINTYENYLNNQ